jgi:transcriptional regulator with XRE-family HTH domain
MQTKAAKVRVPAPAATTASVHGVALRKLRLNLHLTIDHIACALGISPRTVVRKEHDKALAWIRTPNAYFGGETPVRMLNTEVGTDAVTESLCALAYGGVS